MTIAAVLAAIAAIGTIVGGIAYLVKTGVWVFNTTPAQSDQNIENSVEQAKETAEETGRPQ